MPWVNDTSISIGSTTINANTCTSGTTVSMPNLTTSMTVSWTYAADYTLVTGWGPGSTIPPLVPVIWPTANTANVKICNYGGSNITSGSTITLNLSAK